MGKEGVFDAQRSQLPHWITVGIGQTFTNPEGQALTVPSEATIIEIASEDDKCYWCFGPGPASALSPGYIPSDGVEIIGPCPAQFLQQGLSVHGPSSVVHCYYFKEV